MHWKIRPFPIFLIVLAVLTTAYLKGLMQVPFHPDESSYLFMSSDFDLYFQNPASMAWRADQSGDIRQRFRLLNPPLVHILPGLGRWIAGQPALPVDWEWSETWQENQQRGAIPSAALLIAGRMAIAVLYPFSILFLYLAARRATNEFTAWTAALLLASNALVLLHTRRAMAEGPLLVAACLAMWSLTVAEKRPWLNGIPAALAFSAKLTLAALAPVGLLAVLWPPKDGERTPARKKLLRAAKQVTLFGGLALGLVLLLHPFLWQQPVQAMQAAAKARQRLAISQANSFPEQALKTPTRRLIGLIGSLYLTPPMLAETSNYTAELKAADDAYLANPLNTLFRSLPGGAMLLVLTIFGFITACLKVWQTEPTQRRRLALLLLATIIQGVALLALIPLAWQRYYMPLVPFVCLWTAFAVNQLVEGFRIRFSRKQMGSDPAARPLSL